VSSEPDRADDAEAAAADAELLLLLLDGEPLQALTTPSVRAVCVSLP
jgi:hypothetical protein